MKPRFSPEVSAPRSAANEPPPTGKEKRSDFSVDENNRDSRRAKQDKIKEKDVDQLFNELGENHEYSDKANAGDC